MRPPVTASRALSWMFKLLARSARRVCSALVRLCPCRRKHAFESSRCSLPNMEACQAGCVRIVCAERTIVMT